MNQVKCTRCKFPINSDESHEFIDGNRAHKIDRCFSLVYGAYAISKSSADDSSSLKEFHLKLRAAETRANEGDEKAKDLQAQLDLVSAQVASLNHELAMEQVKTAKLQRDLDETRKLVQPETPPVANN